MEIYFVGVDVGSTSVRGALVSSNGHVLKTSLRQIETWKPKVDFFEQSSEDIWNACVFVIKEVTKDIDQSMVKGIGFDATCSLVVLDKNGEPLSVTETLRNKQNVIMWMDHRAHNEAHIINQTHHPILQYVGGKVSLEMNIPKVLWLKRNMSDTWKQIGYLFDLPDFLTWKATGSETRSLCSLVCKWNYEWSESGKTGWNIDYLTTIGLEQLTENNFKKIGNQVMPPGSPCGNGLKEDIAKQLNLAIGTAVATSIIDAHAGGLGMLGAKAEGISMDMSTRLGLICGTSTCHIAVTNKPINIPGIWGPYYSAMIPDMWLNEAGQSASGMLLDFVLTTHPASKELMKKMDLSGIRVYLRDLLQKMSMRNNKKNISFLSESFHMWPDYHGNRSPLADSKMTGGVIGLTFDTTDENLALQYLGTIQALAYGTRHIVDALIKSGYQHFESILICGGLSQDPLYVQVQADAIGIPVLKPREKESVLLGSAILGASAANYYNSVKKAVFEMGGKADVVYPDSNTKEYHDKKYMVFLKMCQNQLEYRKIMST